MKKFTLLILAALIAAVGWSQETLSFGTGTTSKYSILGGWYGYERHAVLYTSSELSGVSPDILSSEISKIAINLASEPTAASGTREIKIYVKEVTETDLSASMFNDWAALVASATLVYSQTATGISLTSGWNVFNFIAPYSYDGGNLLIFTDTRGNTTSGGAISNSYGTPDLTKHWCARIDSSGPLNNSNSNGNNNNGGDNLVRPNIIITYEPTNQTCPTPRELAADNVTASGAEISWTERGTATAWMLEYKKATETNWTSVSVTTNPQYMFTGLTDNTLYNVRVKAVCDVEDESNWASVNFHTLCLPFPLPFTEDFTYWTTGVNYFNPCWTKYTGTGATTYPYVTALSSNNALQFNQGALPAISAAFLPRLNTTGDLALSFDLAMAVNNRMIIVIATDPQDQATWQEIGDTIKDGTGIAFANYKSYDVTIPNYQANTYIGFKSFVGSGTTATSAYLDNVVVTTCPRPTGLAFDNLTSTSVDVTFNAGSQTQWQYVLALSSVTDPATIRPINITSNNIALSGLTPETAYKVWVRSNCSAEFQSVWTPALAFTTLAICPRPTALATGSITGSSVELSWTAGGAETAWVVEYKKSSETNYTSVSVTTNPYTLTGLDGNTTYNVRIKAVCVEGTDESSWVTFTNFTTPCADISVLPWIENFDAGVFSFTCWKRYNGTSVSTTSPTTATTTGSISGPNVLYFDASNNRTAVLPQFAMDINTLQISFSLRKESGNTGTFQVGYLTDINNASTFVAIEIFNESQVGTWLRRSTVLTTVPAGVKNIAFKIADGQSNYYYWVDDIVVDVLPTCPRPTALAASNVTTSSFELSWTAGGTETAWVVEYKKASETDYTSVSVTTNPYTLTGLDVNTAYNVRIKADCGAGDESVWSNVANFRTACGLFSLPFTDDFSGWTASSSYFDPCWTRYAGTGAYSATSPYVSTSLNQSMYFYNTSTTYNAAFMPLLDADGLDLLLEFDLAMTATTGRMDIVTTTDPQSDPTTWNVITTLSNGTGTALANYIFNEVTIPNYQTGTYIGFRSHSSTTAAVTAYLDNIVVEVIPACPKPINLTAGSFTTSSFELSWTASSAAIAWVIEYKKASETNYTPVSVTTNPYTLAGLDVNTVYNVRIKADCGAGDESVWSNVASFRTECGVFSLPFAENFNNWTTSSTYFDPCWTRYTATAPYVSSSLEYSMYFYNNNSNTSTTPSVAFMPLLNAAGLDLALEFTLAMTATTGRMDIVTTTDPQSNPTTWNVITTVSDGAGTALANRKNYKVVIPNYQSGTYIGFRGYTSTTAYITAYLDNIVAYEILTNDVAAISITSSVGTEVVDIATADFTVTVRNLGTAAQTNVPVVLEIDGAIYDTEYIASIASNDTETVVFSNMDVSTLTTHTFNVRAYTNLVTDENRVNDTVSMQLLNEIIDPCVDGVRVGIGKDVQSAVPVSSGWSYTYSQTIYKASEILARGGNVGEISKIAYHWNGSGNLNHSDNWVVYIGQTSKENFADATAAEFVPIVNMEQVYSGIVGVTVDANSLPTSTGAGWMYIELDTPFEWDGESNIVVAVYEGVGPNNVYGTSANWFSTSSGTENRVIYYRNDTSNPNPAALTGTPTRATNYPNIRFNICPLPTCTKPVITLDEVADVTATINWTGGNAPNYVVEWGVAGFELGTGTTATVTDETYTITGLNSLTTYDVYVQGDCGAGDLSRVSKKVTFTTECLSIIVVTAANPYIEGLEDAVISGATVKMSGACWSISNDIGNSMTLSIRDDVNSIDGKYAFVSRGNFGDVASLTSPIFDISALNVPILSLQHIEFGYYSVPNRAEELRIYYRAATTDEWTLVPGMEFTTLADDWRTDMAFLPNPSATYQLRFEVTGRNAMGVGLDNVIILEGPKVTTDSINQDEATPDLAILYKTVIAGTKPILSQGFEYWKTVEGTPVVQISADGLLTGLETGARYEFRAFATTEDDTYYGEIIVFFTGTVDPIVVTLPATNITHNSATLNRSVVSGSEPVISQGFEYRAVGAITWIFSANGLLTGLDVNTAYEFYYFVESDNIYSGDTLTFTTNIIPPTVVTDAATLITYNSATLNKTVTSGSETITAQGFEYRVLGATTWTISGDGLLTGLTENTEYQFRAFVIIDYAPAPNYYGDILPFITGCPVRTGVDAVDFCEGGSVVYEGTTYTVAGVYEVTITLPSGCDSIVTLTVTELPLLRGTLSADICQGGEFVYRGVSYTTAGVRDVRFANATGCDSVVTLTINVMPTYNIVINETICEGTEFLYNGEIYTEAGEYVFELTAINGCDSIVTLYLEVTSADLTITNEGFVLTAVQENATYQWYKGCDATKTPITGATEQSYTVTENGLYSVEITYEECVFTSNCVQVTGLSIVDVLAGKVTLYPNPAKVETTLVIDGLNTAAQVVITDLAGRQVATYNFGAAETKLNINVSNFADGTYFVRIITEKGNSVQKLVVKK